MPLPAQQPAPGTPHQQLATRGWVQLPGRPPVGATAACVRVGDSLMGPAAARELAALIVAAAEAHEELAS